ncbi:MAG: heme ABC exporter ATP-binding protein CcmA [Janthinobacterium lividum]
MVEQDPILRLTPILRLEDVTLARGGRVLFAGLTLTLPAGGAALVTGSNGVGKSSLLRLAAGLLRPDAGQVTATGSRALLAEQVALDGESTLAAALTFWARMDGTGDAAARVAGALDAVALAPLAGVPVRLLSAGQRRRAALARVVAARAALWLLDEPANGLDAGSAARLEELIAAHRAGGGALMVATHQPVAIAGAVEVRLDAPSASSCRADRHASVYPELVEGLPPSPSSRTVLRRARHERDEGRGREYPTS